MMMMMMRTLTLRPPSHGAEPRSGSVISATVVVMIDTELATDSMSGNI